MGDNTEHIIFIVKKPQTEVNSKTLVGGKKTDNRVCKKKNIDDMIDKVTYTRLPSGKATVCEVVLKNGFVVVGVTSCVDINNYDKDLAEELSFKDAKNKLYELAAFDLCNDLSTKASDNKKHTISTTEKEKTKLENYLSQTELLYNSLALFISNFVKSHIDNTLYTSVERGVGRDSCEMKSIILSIEKELSRDIVDMIAWFISNKFNPLDVESYKKFVDFVKMDQETITITNLISRYSKSIIEHSNIFINYLGSNKITDEDRDNFGKIIRNLGIATNELTPMNCRMGRTVHTTTDVRLRVEITLKQKYDKITHDFWKKHYE